jgi:hypothetical protein
MQKFTLDIETHPRQYRRQALLITVVAMVVVYFLWNIRDLSFILYPLKLFVTYVHEAGHGLMALLTGGKVVGFMVSPDGSGLTGSIGGSRALILPAGYLGAALFGSILFYMVNRFPRYINNIAIVLGGAMMLFTVTYARPDENGSPLALFLGIGFSVILIVMGLKLHRLLTMLVLNVLAVTCALEGVMDIWMLTQYISATRGEVHNDAAAFAREVTPLIPASVIALTWALAAVLMLAASVYFSVWKPLRKEVDDTYDAVVSR